ncbi:uncharacterized protein LOC141601359 [Silene latifolia]|uniref:uncharacterized protein LOC141601359 n=1 Tax=Silene latifolia TaxID=37657 RepID=UPI003D78ACC0
MLCIHKINIQCQGPWALAGDFNTVINPDERLGGNTKQSDMDEFIDCLATCGMTDIPATGAFYTWTNKQDPASRIYSRLDRFLVNQEWQSSFPDMMAHFHPAGLFDHSPCTVSKAKLVMTRRASFKYFNMWGKAPDFLTRVKEECDKNYPGHKMFNVVKKLKAIKPRLKDLNKECYADIENATKIAENSKSIQDYYESLLGSRKSTEKVRTEVLSQGRYCTDEHIQMLNKPITNEEIKSIFFNTPNDKAPGPNGYTSAFFKDSWDIIGEDICAAIKDCFTSVEWEFLEQLLHGLGFSEAFSHRVMTCVTSTRFSLCLNGSQFGYFKGQRGLMQGDPISPLEFTLCMDYLTRMIANATDHWPFQYYPLCKGVKLNHLMFADDLLMFCKGNA